ncbi:MAG: PilZ domain-containing protein [Treponema sp.]|nr:PilZ domain-containing protein [Treponema sp.]
MRNDGMLIENRQSPVIFIVALSVVVFALILVVIRIILLHFKKLRESSEYLEKIKNRPTSAKDVAHVARKAGLSKSEQAMLLEICKRHKARNIEYLLRDEIEVDGLFASEYEYLCSQENMEPKKTELFSLRYKLEKHHNNALLINSTHTLKEGQEFIYKDANKNEWRLTLIKNTAQALLLKLPKFFDIRQAMPDRLSKIKVMFSLQSGISYYTALRVIRTSTLADNTIILITAHSTQLKAMQRRLTKRMELNKPCQFSAVTLSQVSNGKHKKVPSFEPLPKRYDGIVQDISSSGCRLKTHLPISQGQNIYLEFSIDDIHTEKVYGLIVMTTQTEGPPDPVYILHIQFIEIDLSMRNKIYALIYDYIA